MAGRLSRMVARTGHIGTGAYALLAGFVTYFCMYAFRKPFTAATYEHVAGWGFAIDFKIVVVVAQVCGYALSKLIGVKVVSEAGQNRRILMILSFIGVSWIGLVLFAVLPAPLKVFAIFLSGLPLGMIWGLVFSFLEGRRTSEVLGAGLCASFIVSSGVVKSAGRWLMVDHAVPEFWMPAATGLMFFPLLALSVYLLSQTPPPDERDKAERMVRTPMYKDQRKAFFRAHAPGLILLIAAYVLLTALRDFRDNFAAEIWEAVGFADAPEVFTFSEIPVAVVVLALLGATMVIRSNRIAVIAYHWVIIAGAAVIAGATFAFQSGHIGALTWMIAVGAGLYAGYVPYNCVLFDRMTAALRTPGNAGFTIYLADASGYAGSVALLLFKNFGAAELSWLAFLQQFCYVAAALIAVTTLGALIYFQRGAFSKRSPHMAADVAHPEGTAA